MTILFMVSELDHLNRITIALSNYSDLLFP